MLRRPTKAELQTLIMWPNGSVGFHRDDKVIQTLAELSEVIGYGRLSQLAKGVQELHDDPEAAAEKYEAIRKSHFESLKWAYAPVGQEIGTPGMFSNVRYNEYNAQIADCNLCGGRDLFMCDHHTACPKRTGNERQIEDQP